MILVIETINVLENLEKVEQLRCIENGIPVVGLLVNRSERSVDTPDDLRFMKTKKIELFLSM